MSLILGQLIYTSFPEVGYKALASAAISTEIQQAFIQQVVYQYWDSYNPPKPGYRAAYIRQVTLEKTLFGWLYNDGLDDFGRTHLPYFLCYYLTELLDATQLENIFTCLRRGPVAMIDRQSLPDNLESIVITDLLSYQPACLGVAISTDACESSHIALKDRRLLNLFSPSDEQGIVNDLNEDCNQQEANLSSYTSYFVNSETSASPLKEDVLKHYQEYKNKLQRYEEVFIQEFHGDPLSDNPRNNLQRIQQLLAIKNEDIAPIEAEINQLTTVESPDKDVVSLKEQFSSRREDVKQVKLLNEVKSPALYATTPAQGKSKTQMTNIALLIGVSDYGSGFNELPRALKDVEAMQQILQHPEIGVFDSVKTLTNPGRQVMEEAIETLFLEGQTAENVLLYFSGHGVKDDSGNLYLTTGITRKNTREKLVKSSAVPVSFVQEIMSESRFKHQTVILDCCFSGTLNEGLSDRNEPVDILNQLGGEGRVILTSSTSTHCDFEQNESESIYTHYLVQGMETGAADLNNDGEISIKELHNYAVKQVQKAIPAMQAGLYGVEDCNQILVAKAPVDESKRRYRLEFDRCANLGEISIVSRSILDVLRDTLGLTPESVAAIEAEVLQPYHEYQQRLQRYVHELVTAIYHGPISDKTRKQCKQLQLLLGLRNEDVLPIEAQIAREIKAIQSSDKVREMREFQIPPPSKAPTPVKVNNASTEETPATTYPNSLSPAILYTEKSSTIGLSDSTHPNFVTANKNSRRFIGALIGALVLTLTGASYELGLWQDSQPLETIKAFIEEKKYLEWNGTKLWK